MPEMPAPTQVTAAVLSYNHPEHTARAVKSVQRHFHDSQIVLLHNGSRAEVEARLKNEFAHIEHVSVEKNAGFSGGANQALAHSFRRSEWVLFITNDCELQRIGEWPSKPGLYAPLIYRRSTQKIDSIGAAFRPLTGQLKHHRTEQRRIEPRTLNRRANGRKLVASLREHFYVPGTAFLLDRDSWRRLCTPQFFDESLHTYWEDVDLTMRAHAAGINVATWTSVQLIHKVGKTCHKDPFYTRYLFQRNRRIVSRRYTSPWMRPLQNWWLGRESKPEVECST